MRMRYEGNWDRLGFDLLEMTDTSDAAFIGWLAGRKQASVEEVSDFLDQSEEESQAVLNSLVEQGVLLETKEQSRTLYQVHFSARRKREATKEIWQALDEAGEVASRKHDPVRLAKKGMRLRGMKELAQGDYGRFWLGLGPLILIFLVCEWLFVEHVESFSQMLGFLGIVALPIEIGVFPALLLYASRRKGDHVPAFVLRFLAHPVVAGTIYLVSVSILFLHGLLIWQDTFQRAVAILVGVVTLGVTFMMVQQGAFARRLVIEVQQASAKEGESTYMVTDTGRVPTKARVRLGYADGERVYQAASGSIPEFPALYFATFQFSETKAQELRVWMHRVSPEGQSENIPALVKVSWGKEIREFNVDGAEKQFVFPLRDVTNKENKGGSGEVGQLEVEVQLAARTT